MRPTRLNEKLIEDIYNELKEGLPIKYACDLFMIHRQSHYQWMARGEQEFLDEIEGSLFALYFVTIKKAQAEYVRLTNRQIREGKHGWQGKAWWLERTKPDFCARQEIKAGQDGQVNVIIGGRVQPKK